MDQSNNSKLDEFINYLCDSDEIEFDGGAGGNLAIPKFDISAKEYLEFAESELVKETKNSKINAVSHLKRALDCQIETFLSAINLQSIYLNNNLKFEAKTEFLANIGILSVKSINKLNKIRNKMEHEYKEPNINDLQAYYDLVWYVIEIIECKLIIISSNTEIEFSVTYNGKNIITQIIFDVENRCFIFNDHGNKTNFLISLEGKEDLLEFIKAFKLYFYTLQCSCLYNFEEFFQNLHKLINNE